MLVHFRNLKKRTLGKEGLPSSKGQMAKSKGQITNSTESVSDVSIGRKPYER